MFSLSDRRSNFVCVAISRWQAPDRVLTFKMNIRLLLLGVRPGARTRPHVGAWHMGSDFNNCIALSNSAWKGLAIIFPWFVANTGKTVAHAEGFPTLVPQTYTNNGLGSVSSCICIRSHSDSLVIATVDLMSKEWAWIVCCRSSTEAAERPRLAWLGDAWHVASWEPMGGTI